MSEEEHDRILQALNEESKVARLAWDVASENFDTIIRETPSGLPHPENVQRIHNASRDLSAARAKFMESMDRTSNFVVHETVPDDLQEHARKGD